MVGAQIAFRDYDFTLGIWGSGWVGWKNFERFFRYHDFWRILWNTLSVSLYSLVAGFPLPIILALILHSFPGKKYTRIVQTVVYMPHFISVVLKVGEQAVIERETSWHASYYTGTICLEAGKEYPVFSNSPVRVYYQTPDQQNQTTIWSEASSGVDYCFLYGPEPGEIVSGYRQLTGDAPLFPKWAYGYWQSKECYRTAQEVLDIVAEHKRRGHPMDAIYLLPYLFTIFLAESAPCIQLSLYFQISPIDNKVNVMYIYFFLGMLQS